MQNLDVISVNFWQILASLLNLLLLLWIVKKLLYKPVKRMLEKRQNAIDERYTTAQQAEREAQLHKKEYEDRLDAAKDEADNIVKEAVGSAKAREKEILDHAKSEADLILLRAEEGAELEKKKAEHAIKDEIVEVSTLLSEKILGREIKAEDHAALIDDFIDQMGDEDA